MQRDTTIAALATPTGSCARLILRTSGAEAWRLARDLGAVSLTPARAGRVMLRFASLTFPALCYAFRGPRSHTGEDVVEYHLPGNPLLGRMLLEELIRHGARQAEPGEFSARALFNGKLRLDEAEGVAAVISASNDRELSAARQLRSGELARRLEPLMNRLADLLALCELGIDFTDEDVEVLPTGAALEQTAGLLQALTQLTAGAGRFEELSHLPRIALVGRPNAGKSTLLNALAGYERAVASPVAGTTRDALAVELELSSGRAVLVDVAGLEADQGNSLNEIDRSAQRRALAEARQADVLVLVSDPADPHAPVVPRPADLVVQTKADLRDAPAGPAEALSVSAVTGANLEALRARLDALAFGAAGSEQLALNARHRAAVAAAVTAVREAEAAFTTELGAEVAALHLRTALDELGSILGIVTPDDLLGRIFSRFCIGK